MAALLGKVFGGWVVALGLLAAAALVLSGNLVRMHVEGEAEPGQTTEFAALAHVWGRRPGGHRSDDGGESVLGGAVAVLLQLRDPSPPVRAAALEKRTFGGSCSSSSSPWSSCRSCRTGRWDPTTSSIPTRSGGWWCSSSACRSPATSAYKLFGAKAGTVLSGALGGLISSTATTASARAAPRTPPTPPAWLALVIMIASTVVFARVLVEIAAVAPGQLREMGPPSAPCLGVGIVVALIAWFFGRSQEGRAPGSRQPGRAQGALIFGALYSGILLAVAFARERFGTAGLYTVAAISGLTDGDAITLSTSRLVAGGLDPNTGWRAILLAALSNLVFSGGIVAVLGSRGLFGRIALLFPASPWVGRVDLLAAAIGIRSRGTMSWGGHDVKEGSGN